MISHFNSNLGATLFIFTQPNAKLQSRATQTIYATHATKKCQLSMFIYGRQTCTHVTKCHCLFLLLKSWMFLLIIIINLSAGFFFVFARVHWCFCQSFIFNWIFRHGVNTPVNTAMVFFVKVIDKSNKQFNSPIAAIFPILLVQENERLYNISDPQALEAKFLGDQQTWEVFQWG